MAARHEASVDQPKRFHMDSQDRTLGMDRVITRRDFLNGVA
jgi:hypothetical protein